MRLLIALFTGILLITIILLVGYNDEPKRIPSTQIPSTEEPRIALDEDQVYEDESAMFPLPIIVMFSDPDNVFSWLCKNFECDFDSSDESAMYFAAYEIVTDSLGTQFIPVHVYEILGGMSGIALSSDVLSKLSELVNEDLIESIHEDLQIETLETSIENIENASIAENIIQSNRQSEVFVAVADDGYSYPIHKDLESSLYESQQMCVLETFENVYPSGGRNSELCLLNSRIDKKPQSNFAGTMIVTHGTKVAGLIASNGDVTSTESPYPDSKLLFLKILDSSHKLGTLSDFFEGVEWLFKIDKPVDVLNMSIRLKKGTKSNSSVPEYFKGECDNFEFDVLDPHLDKRTPKMIMVNLGKLVAKKNTILIAGSGNNKNETDALAMPACLSNVISVGSAQNKNNPELWRNVPPLGTSSSEKLDFLALEPFHTTEYHSGHVEVSSTSFATAYLSGIVALIKSRYPRLTKEQAIKILEASTANCVDLGNGHMVKLIDKDEVDRYLTQNPNPPHIEQQCQ